MPESEKINIIKFLKNPKVQLALFTLLSVIMAIGFFGDNDFPLQGPGSGDLVAKGAPAVSSKFLIATLSPMAAGFTLLPFIISIIGIGISLMRINKQNKENNIKKTVQRFEVIGNEKERLNNEYEKEYDKLLKLTDTNGNSLSSASSSLHLHNIRSYIDDNTIKPTTMVPLIAAGNQISYEDTMRLYAGAVTSVDKLRNIKNKIKAYEEVENFDLSIKMSDKGPMCGLRSPEQGIKTRVNNVKGGSRGIKAEIVSKLAAVKKSKQI